MANTAENLARLLRTRREDLLAFCALLAIAVGSYFFTNLVTESDNLAHIAYAALYRTHGIFFTAFNFDAVSVFKTYPSDLWYGFHLLLAPFVAGENYLRSIQAAGAFLLLALGLGYYFVLKNCGIRTPHFWAIFLFFSSAVELSRIGSMRPQIVISLLAILFFYYAVAKRRTLAVAFIAFLFSFVELSMVWLPAALYGIFTIAEFLRLTASKHAFFTRERFTPHAAGALAVLAGAGLGAFMRPNPIAGLHLFYVQIIYLFSQKFAGVPLPFGGELYPLRGAALISLSPLIAFFIAASLGWLRRPGEAPPPESFDRIFSAAFATGAFFLVVTVFSAARGADLFSLFAVVCIAVYWTQYGCRIFALTEGQSRFMAGVVIFLLLALPYYSELHRRLGPALPVDAYRGAATWLASHSNDGDVVALLSPLDDAPGLFLWNRKDLFQNHADPIFQYAYDSKSYSIFLCDQYILEARITSDKKIEKFCAGFPEADGSIDAVMKNRFGAKYFFMRKNESDAVERYLINLYRQPAYEDTGTEVWKI